MELLVKDGNGHNGNFSLLDNFGKPLQLQEGPPARNKNLTREMGRGGVGFWGGYIQNDEFNDKLTGTTGVETYDRMRRSDAQVQALLFAISLPLVSAVWTIERPENKEEANKVSEEHINFMKTQLFQRLDWPATLRHVLSCLWAGFAILEKVYALENNQYVLSKLSPRLATTIEKWNVDEEDNLIGVQQQIDVLSQPPRRSPKINATERPRSANTAKNTFEIPRDKIALFSYQQEANNYEGQSLLRGAYKHFFIKDTLYKLDSIRQERYAVGIPHIKLPEEYWDTDMEYAIKIAKNWKSGAQSYIITPVGWEVDILQLQSGGTNILESITHHNEEITKAGLAQFINFGTTQTGSRALGEVTTAFFYDSIVGLANWIATVMNRDVVWPTMDLNFANHPHPELKVSNIGAISLNELVMALRIVGDTFIRPSKAIEAKLLELLKLPPTQEEDVIETKKAKPEIKPKPEDDPTQLTDDPDAVYRSILEYAASL